MCLYYDLFHLYSKLKIVGYQKHPISNLNIKLAGKHQSSRVSKTFSPSTSITTLDHCVKGNILMSLLVGLLKLDAVSESHYHYIIDSVKLSSS